MRGAILPVLLGLFLLFTLGAAADRGGTAPELTQRLGCLACHAPASRGEKAGPPLAGMGARLSPEELRAALIHPRSRRARMPSYAQLRPGEMQALINYLANLK